MATSYETAPPYERWKLNDGSSCWMTGEQCPCGHDMATDGRVVWCTAGCGEKEGGATYALTTIADLVTIPIDSLHACLRDLEYAIHVAHLALGEDATPEAFGEFRWTDDGNHSITMTGSDGEPMLKLDVSDATPDAGAAGVGK